MTSSHTYRIQIFHFISLVLGDTPGIIRAATQYGVATRIMDLCTFDITQNPWRCGDLFDAIITDPPCTFILRVVTSENTLLTSLKTVFGPVLKD